MGDAALKKTLYSFVMTAANRDQVVERVTSALLERRDVVHLEPTVAFTLIPVRTASVSGSSRCADALPRRP